uniref:Large ribosomal subunit protein uL10m n=1 Tax=Otus sunia TaxID=257818 RepID=A0A8C8BCL0_9STRI
MIFKVLSIRDDSVRPSSFARPVCVLCSGDLSAGLQPSQTVLHTPRTALPRAYPSPWQRFRAVGAFAGSERGEAAVVALWPIAARSPQDNGYARLLRRQVEEVFRDNRMIAVCHYNSMPGEDMVLMRHYLRKHNIEVKFSSLPQIAKPVLSQSKYKNLLPLFVARNILLVSPELKAKEMLRVLKGVPQVSLLGACIDDTILSRQGVENLAKLPSLEASQGQTVGALAHLPSQTSSLLQRGSAHLTALLDQHIHQLRAREPGSPTEPSPARSVGAH